MRASFLLEYQQESEKLLIKLIDNAKKINIKDIVIPQVDESSLKNDLIWINYINHYLRFYQ